MKLVEITEEVAISSGFNGEPDWLKESRSKAFKEFNRLPIEQSGLYAKYADLLTTVDFSSLKTKNERKAPPEAFLDANISANIVQSDSGAIRIIASKELAKKNVALLPIEAAFAEHGSFLKDRLAGVIPPLGQDKLAHLNRAIFSSGFFLYVPKNVVLEKPISHTFLSNSDKFSLFSRSMIVLEDGASVSILEEDHTKSDGDKPSIHSNLVEVYLKDNANFAFTNIQAHADNVVSLANRQVRCGRDSRAKWGGGYTGGRIIRSRVETLLEGRGSFARDYEVVYGDGSSRSDITTDMVHIGENTDGEIESRGVLRDKSRSTLKGVIKIENAARNAHSFVGNHAILLSKEARADAVPALEIVTNEVTAKHSASVAQLDENQIFYLMTRGLTLKEAVWVIITGFLDPVTSQIPLENTREFFTKLIAERYEKAREVLPPMVTIISHESKGRLFQIGRIAEFADSTTKSVEVEGKKILISNIEGRFYAIGSICSHEYAELDKGFFKGDIVTCPLHLSQFSLKDGAALNPPATEPLPVYKVHTLDQKIYIELEPSSYT
ncbi:MAG: Fe-S cluster assembly protein SufD [Thaumarchaeota archaeon]|nr:Fe-S cluster assembly protein SufD [Nitrososphaerota archaeon]